uniref:ORF25 n=1 Tax=Cydia pomonella granulosis virus TaxID=28289 RepID=A0A097P263_GVCP|nr:ORF25 [Cydia pomonella granulovirus]
MSLQILINCYLLTQCIIKTYYKNVLYYKNVKNCIILYYCCKEKY